ncbi:Uma2 family endonuclease [Spirulina sp. CCNP1310]|uniref:Uma2 family endonuclease n=1 Tax=Spirulina sp. CCNP1310 TaxID=3110249 RepID=UPI002B21FFA9|nr:Uma2 family endonuclease [Spirulina sp. CCNP1310]MEA5418082.1 Uma2 family endonuclease [Spirulina sp. CCNP1310]
MVATPVKSSTETSSTLTLEEFLALPETKPAREYHPGRIETKPMPKGKHSRLQARLARAIDEVAEDRKIALALTELRCTIAGRSIVPDIAVLRWANLPRDEDGEISDQVTCPPDWMIEILSPDQSATLVMEKILFCVSQGTELGWLIDPHSKGITVFNHSRPQIYLPGDTTPLKVLEGLDDWQITHQTLFDWLKV